LRDAPEEGRSGETIGKVVELTTTINKILNNNNITKALQMPEYLVQEIRGKKTAWELLKILACFCAVVVIALLVLIWGIWFMLW
jgi:hypothetical protein